MAADMYVKIRTTDGNRVFQFVHLFEQQSVAQIKVWSRILQDYLSLTYLLYSLVRRAEIRGFLRFISQTLPHIPRVYQYILPQVLYK